MSYLQNMLCSKCTVAPSFFKNILYKLGADGSYLQSWVLRWLSLGGSRSRSTQERKSLGDFISIEKS
jgi:hypothetical protein